MDSEYTRVQLDNGLQVMLKEMHTAPLVSYWLWYRVGSRNELPGGTGLSHWVEHQLFKGTPSYPDGVLDKVISRHGGYWNAMTYLDWTTYFATMPANKGDLILQVEADRMVNCDFDAQEVELERTVIIAEREGHENNPLFCLDEAVQTAALTSHPYRNEIIGLKDDLHTISRDALQAHYQTYYVPNNAVLCVAGDFERQAMLDRINELFAPIPAGQLPAPIQPTEPPQNGERQVVVEGPGETAFTRVSYHVPPTTSDDFFAFTILDSLLTGPSNLNMFGGGVSNKTSLLYQTLVEQDLAVSVQGGLQATIDPYLYSITLTIHPDRQPEDALAALDKNIEDVLGRVPQQEEIQRAVKQARALFAYGSESITNQAFWLGFAEMFDSYEWFENYLARLEAVTPADVQRVAQAYLQPHQRTVGIYAPTGNGLEVD